MRKIGVRWRTEIMILGEIGLPSFRPQFSEASRWTILLCRRNRVLIGTRICNHGKHSRTIEITAKFIHTLHVPVIKCGTAVRIMRTWWVLAVITLGISLIRYPCETFLRYVAI